MDFLGFLNAGVMIGIGCFFGEGTAFFVMEDLDGAVFGIVIGDDARSVLMVFGFFGKFVRALRKIEGVLHSRKILNE